MPIHAFAGRDYSVGGAADVLGHVQSNRRMPALDKVRRAMQWDRVGVTKQNRHRHDGTVQRKSKRRQHAMSKKKKINYKIIEDASSEPYQVLDKAKSRLGETE
jgi:hypothetical protein